MLFALPIANEPVKGNDTSLWVRRHLEDRNTLIVEPVHAPLIVIRPVGEGNNPLVDKLGGVVRCGQVFHVVQYQNDKTGTAKLHRFVCEGQEYEILHIAFQE
jgi:hypothetical protein